MNKTVKNILIGAMIISGIAIMIYGIYAIFKALDSDYPDDVFFDYEGDE